MRTKNLFWLPFVTAILYVALASRAPSARTALSVAAGPVAVVSSSSSGVDRAKTEALFACVGRYPAQLLLLTKEDAPDFESPILKLKGEVLEVQFRHLHPAGTPTEGGGHVYKYAVWDVTGTLAVRRDGTVVSYLPSDGHDAPVPGIEDFRRVREVNLAINCR